MKIKNLAILGLVGLGVLVPNGNLESKVVNSNPEIRMINGIEYRFEGNKVTQLTSDDDNEAKYCVISDIHGEILKAEFFAKKCKGKKVDGIIVTGDIPLNERLRNGKPDKKDDRIEIVESLQVIAKTGLPIFVIPGNHETKPNYEAALKEVTKQYPNIIDMTRYRIFNGDDVDFVSLPGYQTFKIPGRQFIPDDGYHATPTLIEKLGKLRKGLDDPVVLITHGAGKTGSKIGPATIYSDGDVGDENTSKMMRKYNIPFAVVGHIHEAGGIASTFNGRNIKSNIWANQFTVNFGTLERWRNLDRNTYNGMAGIFSVKGKKAKYEMMYFK